MTKDMMPNFSLFQPTTVNDAISLLSKYEENSWKLSGGQDSYDWFKDRAKNPEVIVDLNEITELKGITEKEEYIEIGASTTLTEIVNNNIIKENFSLLSHSAERVASPQIRNAGSIGGNLCQDARCWYYRAGLDCYRAGGNTCYADTPEGMNREHCLFGASRCVAVTPSDCATAITALDATLIVVGPKGEREVKAEDFFIGPEKNITRMTVVESNEILSSIRLPKKWAKAKFYFEKVADRNTWDFALVNIACSKIIENNIIKDIRIVLGGVSCIPMRLTACEDIARESAADEETANLSGSLAARGATPLNYNHFKVPLMENLVKRAIRNKA